jgi:nicotinamidase-related amidase
MIKYYNLEILRTLEELIKPAHTALVVVDVQNDFVIRDGKLLCPKMIEKLRTLIDNARQAGVMVIYLQDTLIPKRLSDSAPYFEKYMKYFDTDNPEQVKNEAVYGTWGWEIIDDIKPLFEEAKVVKYRSDGFIGTGLDIILRSNLIKTIIATGVVTGGCVASTVRSAGNYYFVVVAEDCCWQENIAVHDAAIQEFKKRYNVYKSENIINTWKESQYS